jgi:hypothetical protein
MPKHRSLFLLFAVVLLTTAVFAQTGTIEGTVQLPNDGGPAVGAIVSIHRMHHDSLTTTADSTGQFRFDSVAVGEWGSHAYLAPYVPAHGEVHIQSDQISVLTLVLQNQPTNIGRVEGIILLPNDGGPAAGASVWLFRAHGDSMTTTANDVGEFAFDSARVGEHDIYASLTGYRNAHEEVDVEDGETVYVELELRTIPTDIGRVEGIVLLPNDGGPAAGASVWLFRAHGDSMTTMSDDSGHFAFDSARVGEHDIYALLTGYRNAHEEVDVEDGETVYVELELRAEPTGGGTVEGFVTLSDQTPVNDASVMLEGEGEHHGENEDYHTHTDSTGYFTFQHVQAGPYEATAMAHMHGFTEANIVVIDSQTTQVTLVLDDSLHGGGHHEGDTLATVDLTGIAIVVYPDSIEHPNREHYYIDLNGDGVAEYRLSFGPAWYDPGNGAQRPANGDSISIYGGLLTYTTPPVVVVYTINGLFWREPFHGHGGHGGGDHEHDGCNPDSVTAVELAGTADVHNGDGFHGEHTVYALSTNGQVSALLDFGRPDYNPSNGAQRPADGDSIAIVGGQVYCPNAQIPVVIVYEINGFLWREPGDTLGLGPALSESVNDPLMVGAPLSYLTARNYPNPFNPVTTIQYSIPETGSVRLTVYDLEGREVATLINGSQTAGTYSVAWDGGKSASGIYFYRISASGHVYTSRMLLLK